MCVNCCPLCGAPGLQLFRDMLTMIRGHQLLWMMEGEEEVVRNERTAVHSLECIAGCVCVWCVQEVEEEGVGREQPTMCAVM